MLCSVKLHCRAKLVIKCVLAMNDTNVLDKFHSEVNWDSFNRSETLNTVSVRPVMVTLIHSAVNWDSFYRSETHNTVSVRPAMVTLMVCYINTNSNSFWGMGGGCLKFAILILPDLIQYLSQWCQILSSSIS